MHNNILEQYLPAIIETTMMGKGDSDAHLLPLFSIALASKGRVFVELGVRRGITTLPLLLAAHLNDGMLYSVDIQNTEFVCPPELAAHWTFVKSDALAFLAHWDSAKIMDFVFVDDWHTYPHVRRELKHLERHTTPSSIITLHDLMYGGYEPRYHTNPAMWKGEWAYGGPFRAVDELDVNTWEWSTLPWYSGLTILRKKAPIFSESRLKMWAKRLLRYLNII